MEPWSGSWAANADGDGFPLSGELSTELQPPSNGKTGRRAERVPIELGAGLRQRGAAGVSVQIMDLSIHGFRVATHLELFPGSDVWLRLPGLEPSHAKVVWSEGHYVGCSFERPLHPAVLDMIVQRSRSR
jgi:PilZ domain